MKWNTLFASTLICSKEWVHFVVDSLFIVAHIVLRKFCGWPLFCCAVLSVVFTFATVSLKT